MLELKVLESSNLTEVVVYGNYLYKLRTKWMLQSMAERHRLRLERGESRLRGAGDGGGRTAASSPSAPHPAFLSLLRPPRRASPAGARDSFSAAGPGDPG